MRYRTTGASALIWASVTLGALAIAGGPAGAPAAAADEASSPWTMRGSLMRQLFLIKATVQPYVERADLPALMVLKQALQNALDNLNGNGPSHAETIQALRELVFAYDYCKPLFRQIRSQKIGPRLDELAAEGETLVNATGFRRSFSTRITASVFRQIHRLLQELSHLPIPQATIDKVVALQAPLGRLVATAQGGDDARTFAEAAEVLEQVRALYPDFAEVSASNAAFYIVMEIQGFAELYAKYSAVDQIRKGGAP